MSSTPARVARHRRLVLAAVIAGVVLILFALLIGANIPAAIMAVGSFIALLALILWIIQYGIEQSQARRNAAQGRSWQPEAEDR